MLRKFSAALALAAISFAAPYAAAQDQKGGSTLKATHGAWEVRCDKTNASTCLMTQIGKRADGQPVLRMSLRKTPGAKGPKGEAIAAVLQIDAPLGVLLPAGVTVNIDGRQIGRGIFQVCDARACITSDPIAADFIAQLKKGSNATLSVVAVNGEKADVSISLSGFTKAYDAL